jgi:hypothetical protein
MPLSYKKDHLLYQEVYRMRSNFSKAFLTVIVIAAFFTTGPVVAGIDTGDSKLTVSITAPASGSSVRSPVKLVGKVSGGVPPYTYRWNMVGGTPSSLVRKTSHTQTRLKVSYPPKSYTVKLTVIDSKKTQVVVRKRFIVKPPPPDTSKSINSTSQNRGTFPAGPVVEQPFVNQFRFRILSANDLGMHCGDLDHRIASILPPFNVLHAQVIQTVGTILRPRQILTATDVDVVYSASSNPNDPALQRAATAPIFKTNFWDPNPASPGASLAFNAYNPFYPADTLVLFPLDKDMGLPAPDLALLYPLLGGPALVAAQQDMPGVLAPYAANTPQPFARFDTDFPFFVSFPFGYRLASMNWFAADGIPVAPFDDSGRNNSFPLMRVQAKSKFTDPTVTVKAGDLLASVDAVVPVSAESDCWRCHTSSVDGGNHQAACIPGGVDDNTTPTCQTEGSPRSGTPFIVAQAAEDTADVPPEVKREWAADTNIVRLHDAKHPTVIPKLEDSTPVVCQRCHYSPALDLAHVGPLGPGDPDANGREQKIHQTNSRVMHTFHSQFTDLFDNVMPVPTDPLRFDLLLGKPVVNTFVADKLNNSCYQCHPGRNTKCLRGAMFNGGLVCFDCHGTMEQVGNDFSQNFSLATPFGTPGSTDLNKRIPWANEPKCQSCHTGDEVDNLGLTDPNVIHSQDCSTNPCQDGIRLLQAYRTNDGNATPIVATNKRFAENDANATAGPPTVLPVLYRLSKGHGGVFCEGCHGSTHAEWPVQPESGASIANDNMAAIRLQGHTGKIVECGTCHSAGTLPTAGPTALDGPHGMHVVGDPAWMSGSHGPLAFCTPNSCRPCHGQLGKGTVLAKLATTLRNDLQKGQPVHCTICHLWNPLDPSAPLPTIPPPTCP